jgi:hypothetical protein
MEKSFDLKPHEIQTLTMLEQENLRAHATSDLLWRQMRETDQKILQSEEAQRNFIRQALRERGVEQFSAARLEPGRIVCTLPDEMPIAAQPATKANGELQPTAPPEEIDARKKDEIRNKKTTSELLKA